jgi:hypothetical protein
MQSEVKVFIDGVMRKKSSLKLPQVQSSFSHCRIGTNAEIQSAAHTMYRENPFYGQMGAVCILYSCAVFFLTECLPRKGRLCVSQKNSTYFWLLRPPFPAKQRTLLVQQKLCQ